MTQVNHGHRWSREIRKNRTIYLILLPGLIWFAVFAYYPMSGLLLAFKAYHAKAGILGSPWVGLTNFTHLFRDPAFGRAVVRTLTLNLGKLLASFPVPVLLALMLGEMRTSRYSRVLQTVYTFPHFLSWIVVSGVMINLLSSSGLVNNILRALGMDTVNILGSEATFVPLIYLTEIWKASGWSAIVYVAAISGVDQEQYEAAEMDGATRIQKMFRITLPNIMPTVVVMFILACGNLMTSGFDQIFNLSNAATQKVAEVLDMYIYRVTFQSSTDFGYSTAVSLFRSVVNMALLVLADKGSKLIGGSGLFGGSGARRRRHLKRGGQNV